MKAESGSHQPRFWFTSTEDRSQEYKGILTDRKYGGVCLRDVELKVQHLARFLADAS